LPENENLGCSATTGAKTVLGIIQLWLNYFSLFPRHLAYIFPVKLRKVMPW